MEDISLNLIGGTVVSTIVGYNIQQDAMRDLSVLDNLEEFASF